jgi:cyclase
MGNFRLIARLDIKGRNVVKSIQFEGLRKIGNPGEYARKYYMEGIDEILYMDIVASLYERSNLLDIVQETTQDVFIPITVGGGIRTLEDVAVTLRAGADKIAINTAAVKNPSILHEISDTFGSQCVVLSIEAKRLSDSHWSVYYDNGREKTDIDVLEWAQRGCSLGAGEILLTSVDKEGTAAGFDLELVKTVSSAVPVPVIACGGMGTMEHLYALVTGSVCPDAAAMAYVLHYGKLTIPDIRAGLLDKNIPIRQMPI